MGVGAQEGDGCYLTDIENDERRVQPGLGLSCIV